MEILIVLVLVSLGLVGGALLFLWKSVSAGDYDHGDRLSLLPLNDDSPPRDQSDGPDRTR